MKIKCVVPCRDASGTPDLFPCTVNCSQYEYESGDHYDRARDAAEEARYEVPNVAIVFDENDGPAFLFAVLFPAATPVDPGAADRP